MELTVLKKKIRNYVGKYKYAALILLIGLILMLIPSGKDAAMPVQQAVEQPKEIVSEETRLEEILMQIEGAGKVRVMLTQASGAETVYQTDEDSSRDHDSVSQRRDTVTVTDHDRIQTGLIRQVNPPIYLGAVVVCQGADRAAVKLAVTEAVSKVTNLGADQITVLKMK